MNQSPGACEQPLLHEAMGGDRESCVIYRYKPQTVTNVFYGSKQTKPAWQKRGPPKEPNSANSLS